MPSIIIADEVYDWSGIAAPGDDLAPHAPYLTWLYFSRIRNRVQHALSRGDVSREAMQSSILDFARDFVFDDQPEPDAIDSEAIEIAEETIRTELARAGFPAPKSLRDHALQIIDRPEIIAEARRRVVARTTAAREILGL